MPSDTTTTYRFEWKLARGYYDAEKVWADSLCDLYENERQEYEQEVRSLTPHRMRREYPFCTSCNPPVRPGIVKLIREDVLARVDMIDLVARSCPPPRRTGRTWVTECPFHDGGRPSLNVWPEERRWYCFHCSEGGTCYDWTMRLEGTDFVSAMKLLNDLYP